MKHKILAIVLCAIFSLAVCLSTFILIWFWGDTYKDFDEFTKGVEIPGLADGAVPQGITNYTAEYTEEGGDKLKQEYMFISAYMKEGPSRIYVTGSKTGYVGYVTLKTQDGGDYTGHCGGIATNCTQSNKNGSFWLTGESNVFVIRRTDSSPSSDTRNIADIIIEKAKLTDGTNTIQFSTSFAANCNASFCYYYDDGTTSTTSDRLYVGEFYRKGNYETDEGHHVETKDGKTQRAFVYEYSINNNSVYGLSLITNAGISEENRVPKINYIYSIPDKIQGFARVKDTAGSSGKLVLSQSYGLANSRIYYYDWSKLYTSSNRTLYTTLKETNFAYSGVYYDKSGSQNAVQFTDSSLYVYFVDEASLVREYSIPSMSEGLCASGERINVLFESASYKYGKFVRQKLNNVYTFIPRT